MGEPFPPASRSFLCSPAPSSHPPGLASVPTSSTLTLLPPSEQGLPGSPRTTSRVRSFHLTMCVRFLG